MLTRTIHLLAAGLLCLSVALPAGAELPSRGMSMDKVLNQYGEPQKKTRPVGDPPITRWVYDGFTVYFEGRYALHAVRHRGAAAEADASQGRPAESERQPETPAEPEPAAPAQPQFRFDPATGRVIEVGPDGRPLDAPTASPDSAPAPETDTVPAFDPATGRFRGEAQPDRDAEAGRIDRPEAPQPVESESTAPANESGPRFNPVTGQFEPADQAPAEPAPAPTEEPAAPPAAPSRSPESSAPPEAPATSPLRFNPTTGQFEPVGEPQPPAKPEAAPVEQPEPEREAPAQPAEPEQGAAAEQPETEAPESGAEAGKPADGGEPRFRFDPTTGRIIMDNAPAPTAN